MSEDESEDFDLDAMLRAVPGPRDHHYAFAHMALPSFAFGLEPSVNLERMASDLDFFRWLWAAAAQKMGTDPLPDGGLGARYVRDGELEAVIVTMPEARFTTEAIMIAIVRKTTHRWLLFPRRELRYLTLEVGASITEDGRIDTEKGRRTVLGEWTPQPSHFNYGDGPPPTAHAFAEAAFAKCRGG
jgi:hypothetical protein